MTASFKNHFSGHAAAYAAARPDYPTELFTWLAAMAPARGCAWDCATGNGQAAQALAEHFERIIATDASAEQIANAAPHPRVEYRVAPAAAPGLEPSSIDLVTVAQAVHWFDRPHFYDAATQALRQEGLIAVWSYGLFTIDPEMDAVIDGFYDHLIGPYWPPERKLIDEHYATLYFPFAEITPPEFVMVQTWTLAHVLAYLRTWSAVQRYQRAKQHDPVDTIASEFTRLWDDAPHREVIWPLYLRAGYK
ncbi:MAG: class I SAM-dependent methyltransferase [Gammaproteobacteria bacterium]